jgi:hypothetical protein
MGGIRIGTGRGVRDGKNIVRRPIGTRQRTIRHVLTCTTEVGNDVCCSRRSTGGLPGFQRPFLLGRIYNPKVVDTGIRLRGFSSTHEIGDCDCRQQANDGHNNHNLHQGKTRLRMTSYLVHSFLSFICCGGTKQTADLYDNFFVR